MLNQIFTEWNNLFQTHVASIHSGQVDIIEKDTAAKNKSLSINCLEAVSFPSKQFDGYDMFGALTKKNCDGALLIKNSDNTYDFVYVEMKSRFDTSDVLNAKNQIVETRTKMISFMRMMRVFKSITIKRVLGVINTLKLDAGQINWLSKVQLLPEEKWDFPQKLLIRSVLKVPVSCKDELDVPSEMTFRLVLSDNPHFVINSNSLF